MSDSNGAATATPATDQAPSATPPAPDAGAPPEGKVIDVGCHLFPASSRSEVSFAVKGTKVSVPEVADVTIEEMTFEAWVEHPGILPFVQAIKKMLADKGWIPKPEPKVETPQPTAA